MLLETNLKSSENVNFCSLPGKKWIYLPKFKETAEKVK